MKKRFSCALIVTLLLVWSSASFAQDQTGVIRGTIYRDLNTNGLCVNEGEPRVAANIPLELVSDDANELTRITSAADGTYAYTTDALGLWRVTVVPGQGWRVTSQQTLEVVLSADNPEQSNFDFCVVEISQAPDGGETTLPESGIAVSPPLLVLAAMGFFLIAAGSTLLLIGKLRNN